MFRPRPLSPDATPQQVDDYCVRYNRSWVNWYPLRFIRFWRQWLFPAPWSQGRRYFSRRWWTPDSQ